MQYINTHLSEAIYTLTIHEGDARKRLAAVLRSLKKISLASLPQNLVKEYKWVMGTIERGRSKVFPRTMPDYNLPHIRNSTASKVIEKIVKIKYKINEKLIEKLETPQRLR